MTYIEIPVCQDDQLLNAVVVDGLIELHRHWQDLADLDLEESAWQQ